MQNVSELVREVSKKYPNKKSIINPVKDGYESYTFTELEAQINRFCNKFLELGVRPQDKVLFFVKPNLDFCAITFALFRIGAVPAFIDPGMPKKKFFKCIRDLEPDVLVGVPIVHFLSCLFYRSFSNIRLFITTAKSNGVFRAKSLYKGLDRLSSEFSIYSPCEQDLAAILFTSGGTGAPKGVEYTHDIFISQTHMLQKEFSLTHQDIDIPGFPLFSFFTLAMGMTSCVPDMDAAKPAKCDPAKLYKNITDHKASFVAGSPAIWERLAYYCDKENLTLPSVKYLVMFGAPVRDEIHIMFKKALPNGTTYTPYGATECLPVANISGKEILKNTTELTLKGAGTCIGKAFVGVDIKIINETDEVVPHLDEKMFLGEGEIGEIIVKSSNVTKKYYQQARKTIESKIYEQEDVWHRMGDVGYMKNGRLWFLGRKAHVVKIGGKSYYPIPIETIFNQHPNVKKSALIYDESKKRAALVIERKKPEMDKNKLKAELLLLSQKSIKTKDIVDYYFKDKLPVDIRHNIKIDRLALAREFGGTK